MRPMIASLVGRIASRSSSFSSPPWVTQAHSGGRGGGPKAGEGGALGGGGRGVRGPPAGGVNPPGPGAPRGARAPPAGGVAPRRGRHRLGRDPDHAAEVALRAPLAAVQG